jgi:hypothetical protein
MPNLSSVATAAGEPDSVHAAADLDHISVLEITIDDSCVYPLPDARGYLDTRYPIPVIALAVVFPD